MVVISTTLLAVILSFGVLCGMEMMRRCIRPTDEHKGIAYAAILIFGISLFTSIWVARSRFIDDFNIRAITARIQENSK